MAFRETVERLAGNEFLGDLPLELDAMGAMLGHGFDPPKARRSQSIPNLQDVAATGALQMPCPIMPRLLLGSVARMALRITGSRELANASRVLPLIPTRRFLISAQPSDQLTFEWLSVTTWVY